MERRDVASPRRSQPSPHSSSLPQHPPTCRRKRPFCPLPHKWPGGVPEHREATQRGGGGHNSATLCMPPRFTFCPILPNFCQPSALKQKCCNALLPRASQRANTQHGAPKPLKFWGEKHPEG